MPTDALKHHRSLTTLSAPASAALAVRASAVLVERRVSNCRGVQLFAGSLGAKIETAREHVAFDLPRDGD